MFVVIRVFKHYHYCFLCNFKVIIFFNFKELLLFLVNIEILYKPYLKRHPGKLSLSSTHFLKTDINEQGQLFTLVVLLNLV